MNKYFEHARLFQGDCFIADYTQMTHCDRGVEIAEKPFEDIAFCQLKNPNEIVFWGVNFEECSSFFKNPVTKTSISQCECMFVSAHAKKKGWVCLIEMKYCLEKNIEDNAQKAYKQLFE